MKVPAAAKMKIIKDLEKHRIESGSDLSITEQLNQIIESFIMDYNARVEEINDEMGGIFELEEDDFSDPTIRNYMKADRHIVSSEPHLVEMWRELKRLEDLEVREIAFIKCAE